MANMTLLEMLNKVSMYTRREIGTPPFMGEALQLANEFTDGINYAYVKICKEKYNLIFTEDVTLNNDLQFDVTSLSKNVFEIKKITYEEVPLKFIFINDTNCYIPDGAAGGLYKATYSFTPDELVNLDDMPIFPNGAIDNRIICYYATYHFLNMEIDSSGVTWLNLFNDGYSNIRQSKGASEQVKSVARW